MFAKPRALGGGACPGGHWRWVASEFRQDRGLSLVLASPAFSKRVRSNIERAKLLLRMKKDAMISLAPSYVSEFSDVLPQQLIAGLEALGFAGVSETSLGSEKISAAVGTLMNDSKQIEIFSAFRHHAIVYAPIPCEEACPSVAIMERSHMVDVIDMIKGSQRTVALLAPALGAEQTASHEAEELHGSLRHGQSFMTTRCCPAYMRAVEKHVSDMAPVVSDTPTPMHYSAQAAKQADSNAVTVFVGPCIAKSAGGRPGRTDAGVAHGSSALLKKR